MRLVVPKRLSASLEDWRVLLGVYLLAAAAAAMQRLALPGLEIGGRSYPPFQNYILFRNAFFHLVDWKDLYAAFPLEQADLFKYTPTYALAMAPFAALPHAIGAVAWSLVNAAALFGAVRLVPTLDARPKAWILWFAFLSLVSSMQTAQSNGVMAGLMLGAFAARERGRPGTAALLVAAAAFAKPFGLWAVVACFAQPGRRRFLAWLVAWSAVLLVAPLAVVPPRQLAFLYGSWLNLLQHDFAAKTGLSVMGWLQAWFGVTAPKNLVIAIGAAALVLPLARPSRLESAAGRAGLAASVLIFVVVFNHMAESPTYVLAVLGVAVWYFSREPARVDTVLLLATFLFSVLSATDLVPRPVRTNLVAPYALKAAPCIAVWLKIQYDLAARPAASSERG